MRKRLTCLFMAIVLVASSILTGCSGEDSEQAKLHEESYKEIQESSAADKPSLVIEKSLANNAENPVIEVKLNGAEYKNEINADCIICADALEDLKITSVDKKDSNTILLTTQGIVKESGDNNIPYLDSEIEILSDGITSDYDASGFVNIVTANAYLYGKPNYTKNGQLEVSLALEGCDWNGDNVNAQGIKLTGALVDAGIASVNLTNNSVLKLLINISQDKCNDIGVIEIDKSMTDANKNMGVSINFENVGICSEVEVTDNHKDALKIRVESHFHDMDINKSLDVAKMELSGILKGASVEGCSWDTDGDLVLELELLYENMQKMMVLEGHIRIPVEYATADYSDLSQEDLYIYVNLSDKITGQGDIGNLLATATANDVSFLISDNTVKSDVMLTADPVTELTKDAACAFITEALKGLGMGAITGAGETVSLKLLAWLGYDAQADMRAKLDDVFNNLTSLSKKIDELDSNVKTLMDKAESERVRGQLRDIQKNVQHLKAKIPGYQNALNEIRTLDSESKEYKESAAELADMIANTYGVDFWTELYSLGELLCYDASQTEDGAIKSYHDRVYTIHNWESQTYDELEAFTIYALGTYTQASILEKFALDYIINNSSSSIKKNIAKSNLELLKSQNTKVSALAEKYKVVRLDTSVQDRNLRANVLLEKSVNNKTIDPKKDRLVDCEEIYEYARANLGNYSRWNKKTAYFPSTQLLSIDEANTIMKYSKEKSLTDELKSMGFTVTSGSWQKVLLGDMSVYADYWSTGRGINDLEIMVYYNAYDTKLTDTFGYFFNMYSSWARQKLPFDSSKMDQKCSFGTMTIKGVTFDTNFSVVKKAGSAQYKTAGKTTESKAA